MKAYYHTLALIIFIGITWDKISGMQSSGYSSSQCANWFMMFGLMYSAGVFATWHLIFNKEKGPK